MTAEAIKRDYPHMRDVRVDVGTIDMTDPNTGCRYMYLTPARVAETIIQFDHAEPIKPFRLGLRVGFAVGVTAESRGRRATLCESSLAQRCDWWTIPLRRCRRVASRCARAASSLALPASGALDRGALDSTAVGS